MKHSTHFFIAVPIKEEQRNDIQNWLKGNKQGLPFQSWVHPQDYHITLAFLGNVESKALLQQLIDSVGETVAEHPSFSLNLKGLGVFGREEFPRIFWAGVEASQALNQLREKVYQVSTNVGFSLDSKPFKPHITLARRWKSKQAFTIEENFRDVFKERNEFTVSSIHLYQTHLDRVPKYETIAVFPLKDIET